MHLSSEIWPTVSSGAVGKQHEPANESTLLPRVKRLEVVRAIEESNRPFKVEFAYLKQLPREYSSPRHIVSVSKRPDGPCGYEERPGPPPPNHAEKQDHN